MVPTGSEWGLCVSDVIFSYNACDASINSGNDKESNGNGSLSDGWSPEEAGGVCTSMTSFFSNKACDTSKNWKFDEESNGNSHTSDGWSPEKMGLYVSDVKFLYMTCKTLMNCEFYEKSNVHNHLNHRWSTKEEKKEKQ
jgi:hypothetical protein